MASLSSLRTLPGRQLDNTLQACPTSSTTLTAKNSVFFELTLVNTNASDRTVTFTDGQGSAVAMGPIKVSGTTATGGSAGLFNFASQNGILMISGIKISADGAGVNYSIMAFAEGLTG